MSAPLTKGAQSAPAPSAARTDPVVVASDTRRAALLLHALAAGDRESLLAELPELQRATLRGLLAELDMLGIPADRNLLEEVIAAPVAASAQGSRTTQDDSQPMPAPLRALRDAAIADLVEAVRDEPAGLVAHLLSLADWTWREPLLGRLGAARRRQIEECLSARTAPPPPAVADALVTALTGRLQRARESAVPARGWASRVTGIFRKRALR